MSRSKEKTVVLLCFALTVVSFVIVQKSDLLILKTWRPPQVKALLVKPQLSDLLNTSSPKVESLLNKRKPTNESPLNMLESTAPGETNVLQNKPKLRMEGIPNTPLETSQKEGISDTSKPKVMATNHKCPHGCVSLI